MKELIVAFVLALTGAAAAQPAAPPPAAPAEGSAAPAAEGSAAAPAGEAPAPAPAAAPSGDAHKVCIDALNADPELAKRVVATYEKKTIEKLDQDVIEAHTAANAQIAENERHVIYAYAAMWILAALFLVYMWMRQRALKAELVALRRDLDAAAKESK
jgi:hypothetical protein